MANEAPFEAPATPSPSANRTPRVADVSRSKTRRSRKNSTPPPPSPPSPSLKIRPPLVHHARPQRLPGGPDVDEGRRRQDRARPAALGPGLLLRVLRVRQPLRREARSDSSCDLGQAAADARRKLRAVAARAPHQLQVRPFQTAHPIHQLRAGGMVCVPEPPERGGDQSRGTFLKCLFFRESERGRGGGAIFSFVQQQQQNSTFQSIPKQRTTAAVQKSSREPRQQNERQRAKAAKGAEQ